MVTNHLVRNWAGVLLLLGVTTAAPAQDMTETDVDRTVEEALRAWHVPGAAVVIVRGDKLVHLKGHGRREWNRDAPVTGDTVFPLASCTKAFTALGLAIAVDDGKISWNDRVRKHLPDFRLFDPNANELVTVRDLMCHRTGVGGHDLLWYRAPWDQAEAIRRIGRMPPSGPFRSTFAYQSIMVMAAGRVVGGHYDGGWAGLTRERILKPLEMTATTLTGTDAAKAANRAVGHVHGRAGTIERMLEYPIPEANPAGSVYTTARDLANWLQFQLGDGTWHGRRVVSESQLRETQTPQTLIPLEGVAKALNPHTHILTYAMGWVVQDYRGIKILSHAGWIDGFRVHLVLVPAAKVGLAVLANLHGTRMNVALGNRLVDLLMKLPETDWNAYFFEQLRADAKTAEKARRDRDRGRNTGEKPTLAAIAYAGEYEHPAYGTCKVAVEKDRLLWSWSSFQKELEPYRGDVFEIQDEILHDPLVTFVIDKDRVAKMKTLDVEFTKVK